MSLANLTALSSAVSEWLYRAGDTALAARANDFVSLFESDFLIDPEMRTAEMEEVDTTTIDGAAITLPDGFIDMIRLQVIGTPINAPNQRLDYVSPSEAAKLDATTSTSGIARNYTVIAGQIIITPQKWAPTGATLELVYNSFTKLADASGNTNWLLQKYPNLYLYGSLMQAAAYIDDDNAVGKWKAGRDEAMAKLALTEKRRKLGGSPLRVTPSASFIR